MALKKLLPAPPYSAGIFDPHHAELEQVAHERRIEVSRFVHFAHIWGQLDPARRRGPCRRTVALLIP